MKDNLRRWVIGGTLFIFALTAQAGIYTFKVTDPQEGQKLTLKWNADNTEKTVELVNGEGTVERNNFQPQFVTLKYGRSVRTLYLDPAQNLQIAFDGESMYKQISFAGEGAKVNNYLNQTKFAKVSYEDTRKPEAAFIQTSDSVYQANLAILESAGMGEAFVKAEKERLKYTAYAVLPMYQNYHKYFNKLESYTPSDVFYDKLKDLQVYDAALLAYPEYKQFITNAVLANVYRKGAEGVDERFMEYVTANIKDAKVLEYITDSYVFDKVSNSGVDETGALIDFYHQHVKNADMTKRFDARCDQWAAIKAGQPSPVFSCPDINGKMVSLNDLKGKYVYIDVWATWCGPCRGELPHLKKLEEAYAGKNIEFVSLSCDRDKSAWEKMVKGDEMKGIQLYMGPKDSFMEKYIINGIPRFILLDTEGRILKANAPRPSDPEIKDILSSLVK